MVPLEGRLRSLVDQTADSPEDEIEDQRYSPQHDVIPLCVRDCASARSVKLSHVLDHEAATGREPLFDLVV